MLTIIILSSIIVKAQAVAGSEVFAKYLSKNYRLPEELKSNCEWMYAIVKLKTDKQNKVVGYSFINTPVAGMKKSFDFLVGYKLSKSIRANGRSVVFYLGVDNLQFCREKPGDKVFYAPNDVVAKTLFYLQKIKRNEPGAILMSNLIFVSAQPSNQETP